MRRLDLLLTSLLASSAGAVVAAAPPVVDALGGAWTFDPALSSTAPADQDAAVPAGADTPAGGAGHRHGGGMGGAGGGSGGHGGGRHGDRPPPPGGGHGSAKEQEAEQGERGLARVFAKTVTITPLRQRVRFDDGEHAIELDRDGMNISGPGVGGTVALTATSPDLVVETLTDSGYSLRERYRFADDGKHLEMHVTLKRPDSDQVREFVRVFDRERTAADPAAQ